LNVPAEYFGEMSSLVWGMPAIFFVHLLASGLTGILNGIQRVDVGNYIFSGAMVLNGLGIFFVLSQGYGLIGLMANLWITGVLWTLGALLALQFLIPGFALRPRSFSRLEARSLMRYGFQLQVTMIAGMMLIPTARVLLSRYVSLASVSYFELASGMALQARSFFGMLAIPLVPAASHLAALKEWQGIRDLYRQSFRRLFLAILPASALLIGFARPFSELWLGQEVPMVASTLTLLGMGWFLTVLNMPAYFLLQGMGFAGILMKGMVLAVVCNAILGWILAQKLAYYGIAIGLVLALAVASAYLIRSFHQLVGISAKLICDSGCLKAFGCNLILLLLLGATLSQVEIGSFWVIGVISLAYFTAYASILVKVGGLRGEAKAVHQHLTGMVTRFLSGRA
jgi:O-antigen/teichoic acid export membrane protein